MDWIVKPVPPVINGGEIVADQCDLNPCLHYGDVCPPWECGCVMQWPPGGGVHPNQ